MACELLELYFARVGGFCRVRDAAVRLWYEALATGTYSAEYHARQQAQRAADGRRLRLALAEIGRVHRSGPEGLSAGGAGGPDQAAAEDAAEARRTALWNALTAEQRAVALAAIGPAFTARCEQWGQRSDDPKLWPVRLATALSWALAKWPVASGPTSDLFAVLP